MHEAKDKLGQDARIKKNLENITYPIIVMSGKGGVGKSTVAVNLAYTLSTLGYEVGILDVDVHGPNIPKMLGIEDQKFAGTEDAIEPVQVLPKLKAASIGLIGYDPDQALIWRGPIKISLVRQFIGDVVWGKLDFLIMDTPPGTGDELLTLAQTIPNLAGAVIVTTPQDVSILDSRKSLNFAKKLNVAVLGIIENMSGFVCPCCNTLSPIFKQGGGQLAAEALDVNFLGAIPLEPAIVQAGDNGKPYTGNNHSSLASDAFKSIIQKIIAAIETNKANGVYNKVAAKPDFKPER